MAREIIVRMSDDFDPTQEADTFEEFVIDGVQYTVDLTTEHAEEFRAYLAPYIAAAHEAVKVIVTPKSAKARAAKEIKPGTDWISRPRQSKDEAAEERRAIREWARASGVDVPVRGQIPQAVRDAYTAATGIPVEPNPASTPAGVTRRTVIEDPAEPNSMGITNEMREWAREHGYPTHRGYVKKEHRDLFWAEKRGDGAPQLDLQESTNANGNGVHA